MTDTERQESLRVQVQPKKSPLLKGQVYDLDRLRRDNEKLAADRDHLAGELERLREACRPLARAAAWLPANIVGDDNNLGMALGDFEPEDMLTVGDLRRLAALLPGEATQMKLSDHDQQAEELMAALFGADWTEEREAHQPSYRHVLAALCAARAEGLEEGARLAVRKSCTWTEYEDSQSGDYRRGVEEGSCAIARASRARAAAVRGNG